MHVLKIIFFVIKRKSFPSRTASVKVKKILNNGVNLYLIATPKDSPCLDDEFECIHYFLKNKINKKITG